MEKSYAKLKRLSEKNGAAEFQADKNDYRALLTALSGASGVPVTAAIDTEAK